MLTLSVFAILTLFTFQSKVDWSFMGAGLSSALWILIFWGFFSMMFGMPTGGVYSLFGALLFSGYIIFDTFLITQKLGSRPARASSADRSRRRRGCDVNIPRRPGAATPRLRREYSAETSHGDAAAETWNFGQDRRALRLRRLHPRQRHALPRPRQLVPLHPPDVVAATRLSRPSSVIGPVPLCLSLFIPVARRCVRARVPAALPAVKRSVKSSPPRNIHVAAAASPRLVSTEYPRRGRGLGRGVDATRPHTRSTSRPRRRPMRLVPTECPRRGRGVDATRPRHIQGGLL